MGDGDTLWNAVIGAAVGLLLSFLPFAIVIGGAVAGYLQGVPRDYRAGARVGGLAGLLAFLVVLVVGGLVLAVLGIPILGMPMMRDGMMGGGMAGLVSLAGVLFLLLGGSYLVGGGALGGAIGAYVDGEL
ncbi:DUF5518 domain-containing protein [Halosegnis sp.]|uniref:DUF5518 domain-containing protein n=1 Tax=Halosegnis sp. TaxID=2864959 RepID=UPI0035D5068A